MNWFRSISARERNMVAAAAAIIAITFAYLLAWEPLAVKLERDGARIKELQTQFAWMQAAAAEARLLRGQSPAPADGGSLLGIIDQSTRSAGLAERVKRVVPVEEDSVRVSLVGAPFAEIMRWFGGLSDQGVLVLSAQIERHENPGHVDVRVLMGRRP